MTDAADRGTDESQCLHAQSTELAKDRLSHDPPRGNAGENIPALSNEAGSSRLGTVQEQTRLKETPLGHPVCFLLWQNPAVASPEFHRAVQGTGLPRCVSCCGPQCEACPKHHRGLQAHRVCTGHVPLCEASLAG